MVNIYPIILGLISYTPPSFIPPFEPTELGHVFFSHGSAALRRCHVPFGVPVDNAVLAIVVSMP